MFNLKNLLILPMFSACMPAAFADDCLPYKLIPDVQIIQPITKREVVRSAQTTNDVHGNVVATLVDNFELTGESTAIEGGFCIALKSVVANIGYSGFTMNIDSRYAPGSCEYDEILAHENGHTRIYTSVITDYENEILEAVKMAADSITPVYVSDEKFTSAALDTLNDRLQAHPEIILMRQKIHAEEEIRNKNFDQTTDISNKCI